MRDILLTLNAGSSSIKFAVFKTTENGLSLVLKGQVEDLLKRPRFSAWFSNGKDTVRDITVVISKDSAQSNHQQAISHILNWLKSQVDENKILAVGHRVVFGGDHYNNPVIIDDTVYETIKQLIPLMPSHLPHNIACIGASKTELSHIKQVACFDTSFHQGRDPVTEYFSLPHKYYVQGIKRYGFHGLSYEYIVQRMQQLSPKLANKRIIIAHLGNGCSMAAVDKGKCVDTSMSFSTLDGLPMGTRCGSIDPGVLIHLMREEKLDIDELENILYKQSGLLGLSGISSDLRTLEASEQPAALRALDYFVYRIKQTIGSLAASMNGVDGIIFTGGIGENSSNIRHLVCKQLQWLDLTLNPELSSIKEGCLTTTDSRCSAWVVPTDEEFMIAKHAMDICCSEV